MRTVEKLILSFVILFVGTFCLGIAGTYAAQPKCERLEGWVLLFKTAEGCTSPTGLCTAGIFLSSNPNWNGAKWFFTALGTAPSAGLPASREPATTLSYAGTVRITTLANNSITTSNTGVFDPAAGAFSQLDRVTGGTGQFSGAKGFIWLTGTGGDLIAGIRGEVRGNLCSPD